MDPLKYFKPWRMWQRHDLKSRYDVVIIGSGPGGYVAGIRAGLPARFVRRTKS